MKTKSIFMEVLIEGAFGRVFGWVHQLNEKVFPAITDEGEGPYCSVFFKIYK